MMYTSVYGVHNIFSVVSFVSSIKKGPPKAQVGCSSWFPPKFSFRLCQFRGWSWSENVLRWVALGYMYHSEKKMMMKI